MAVAAKVRRAVFGFVAAVLTAGAAPAAESPACGLLDLADAEAALGTPVLVKGDAEKNGQSDCGWSRRSGGMLSLTYWSPAAFADGKPTAAERYASRAGKLKGGRVSEPEGLAEKARLVDESAPGVPAYTIVFLSNGAVAELSARGVTKTDALNAARAIAARMQPAEPPPPATPPADLRPTGEPPPEPQPEPELQPSAPAPPPEPPPARAAKTGSPACKLVSGKDLAALSPADFAMADGGPAREGESSCSWRDAAAETFVAVTLLDKEAIPESAAAYFEEMEKAVTGGGAQLVAGVGQRAILETTGEGDAATRSLSILANGRIVFLNTTGVSEEEALALGRAVAGRM